MIGVMSGTSADGIDVAIVRIGNNRPELVYYREQPMPEELREQILRLAKPGVNEIDPMGELDRALGEAIAGAVLNTMEEAGLAVGDITAIGSHGQTIRHRPGSMHPFSLQIGCPSTIAELTGITTIADFRRRDMAAGGEGAPLTPFTHRILFGEPERNVAVLNIGGIANITCIPARGPVSGFDTGPGNMVMDGLMLILSDGRYSCDRNGELAASGKLCKPLLDELLSHPYFRRKPPKSTGREEFGHEVIDRILGWQGIPDADRIRTALELTALSIADSRRFLSDMPDIWFVCGGGASNTYLMRRLGELLAPARVLTTADKGVPADAVEAMCFAILAWHTLLGRPNTLPEITGAGHAVPGGHIVPGENWPGLLSYLSAWTRLPTP